MPKKGFQKSSRKKCKNGDKKSSQKSFATCKGTRNSAKKVPFPKKCSKECQNKVFQKKVQEKGATKMGLNKSAQKLPPVKVLK